MTDKIEKEVKKIIKELNLKCSIKKFQDKVDWYQVSHFQELSEDFIRKFNNKVDWDNISIYQICSEDFIIEFQDEIDELNIELYNEIHKNKTHEQKWKEIKRYARKYKLQYDNEFLYAYRNHDNFGRGMYNKTFFYEKNKYYKDWHCDIRRNEELSFGFTIWPKGKNRIKVKIKDWGTSIFNSKDGKARVWGFEII